MSRRNTHRKDLHDLRQSRKTLAQRSSAQRASGDFLYLDMFCEDIGLMLMPVRGYTNSGDKLDIQISGTPHDQEVALGALAALSHEYSRDLSETVCEAIRNIGSLLAHNGTALFEIIRDPKDVSRIAIEWFPSEHVYFGIGTCVQFIPRSTQGPRRYVWLQQSSIWKVEMPHILGGSMDHKRRLAAIRRYQGGGPEFLGEFLSQGAWPKELDFKSYKELRSLDVARTTRTWGWSMRSGGEATFSMFYWAYRQLKFAIAIARLRTHILMELNALFPRLGANAHISIAGLSSSLKISNTLDRFVAGELTIKDALESVRD